jgi:hypothetical protein
MSSSTVEFRDSTIAVSDLATVSSTVTNISFVGYSSKEWAEIGQRLATVSQLKTVSAKRCDSEDVFVQPSAIPNRWWVCGWVNYVLSRKLPRLRQRNTTIMPNSAAS